MRLRLLRSIWSSIVMARAEEFTESQLRTALGSNGFGPLPMTPKASRQQ